MGGGGIPAGLRAAEPVALQDREHPPPVLGLRVLPHLKIETHDAPLSRKITFQYSQILTHDLKTTLTTVFFSIRKVSLRFFGIKVNR